MRPLLLSLLLLAALPGGRAHAQPEPGPRPAEDGEDEELDGDDDGEELDDDEDDDEEDLDPDDEDEDEDEEEPSRYVPNTQGPAVPRTVCEGRRIRDIEIVGVQRVDEEDVLASMELREGLPCTDREIARDANRLWALGFFDDIVFDATLVGEEIDLLVRLVERPAIGAIEFRGNDEVDDEDIDEKVTLREGAILSIPEVQRQVTKIRDLYAEKGFFLARVRYELIPGDNGEVTVRFLIEEGEEVTVRRVRFIGNDNVRADELTEIMQTSETGFFSFLASNDSFNQDHFDEDLTRIQAYYYDQGYLSVAVGTPRVELTPDRRYIDVTVPIREGPRFRIGEIRVQEQDDDGNEIEPLDGREALLARIETEPGDWFSRTRIALGLQDITRRYRDEGFARVRIEPNTDLDMEESSVDVIIAIRRGPPVRVERINIRGNSKTRDQVIRREIRLNEGDLYSQSSLEDARRRVTALGYFEGVDVSEEEGSSDDLIVLNFEVRERSTGTFQVGAGFSSIESFILTAQIQQNNFLGRGQSLQLQLQLSGIRQLAQVRFVEPWFLGTEWSFAVEGFKTIRQFLDFNRDSTGGGLTLGHPIVDPRFRFFVQYRVERVDISARTGGLFGSGSSGRGFDIFQRLPISGLQRDGRTSSVRLSLNWDSRDNRLFPTDGVFAGLSSEIADRFTGSENIFVRNELFARYYRQLFNFLVLKANFEVGLITSREGEGVPVFERYFLGGIFNVRGFRLNSLGPRVGLGRGFDPNLLAPAQGVSVGGNLQAFYNLELEFPIIESVGIRGVVFTDGGNAWNLEDRICEAPRTTIDDGAADHCSVNPFRVRTSWGFGFRWFSPLGPLRFEWGIPFRPRSFERKVEFEFTIGNFF